jgi:hypothetical protein
MEFTEVLLAEFYQLLVRLTATYVYQAHAKSLLAKEWLAKSNSASSTPYLFVSKFEIDYPS